MSYPEALRYVADKYKILIEGDEKSVEQSEADLKKENILSALKWAQCHFSDNLTKDKIAIDYLKKRNLVNGVKDFFIGYATSGNDLLLAAASAGYSTKVLLDAGLVKVNDQDGHFYDAFSKRLIFPFHDRSGRIIGFTGRLLIAQEGKPKYLNTSETEVFRKSRFLYCHHDDCRCRLLVVFASSFSGRNGPFAWCLDDGEHGCGRFSAPGGNQHNKAEVHHRRP